MFRYILFCAPAAALLAGTGLACLARAMPGGATAGRAAARPGDAVLYDGPDPKYFPAAYPYGLARLHDIGQARTPSQAGNLTGRRARAAVVRWRLAHVRRVWLVAAGNYPRPELPEAPVSAVSGRGTRPGSGCCSTRAARTLSSRGGSGDDNLTSRLNLARDLHV